MNAEKNQAAISSRCSLGAVGVRQGAIESFVPQSADGADAVAHFVKVVADGVQRQRQPVRNAAVGGQGVHARVYQGH